MLMDRSKMRRENSEVSKRVDQCMQSSLGICSAIPVQYLESQFTKTCTVNTIVVLEFKQSLQGHGHDYVTSKDVLWDRVKVWVFVWDCNLQRSVNQLLQAE